MKFKEVAISDASTEAKVAALALLLDKELIRLADTILNVKKLEGPKGEQGIQGPKGEQGDRGFDGANGKDGVDGKDGKDGEDGKQGVGVADAKIDFDGSLVITLTDGTEINAGDVLPLDTAEKIRVIGNGGGTSQYVLDAIADLQSQITEASGLPTQTGNAGKFLTTDGTTASWATVSSTGSEADPIYTASSWYTTTNNASNWDTAYTDRNKWDGGATGLVAATGRTSLGVTATGSDTTYAYRANNLSDLANVATARSNLGLGTAATTNATDYATAAQGAKADTALQSFTETDPVFVASAAHGISGSDITSWNTAYTDRNKWDGGATGLVAATGRTSLGLGTAATTAATDYATAAQGAKADTALQSISSSDVTTALGYTPYNSTNPNGYTSNTGTVTSVGLTTPTGLSVTGSPVTSSGTLALSLTAGYSIPTTASQANWDTAYTDRNKWDGGATGLNAATGRTSLGLGTAATTASTDYATAAQGTKADTAYGWGNHATYGYLTSSSTLDASKLSGTIDGGTY